MDQQDLRPEIRDIGPGGREVALVWSSDRVREMLAEAGIELAEGVCEARLSGQLTRQGESVLLRGELQASYWVPCGRCLEPAAISQRDPAIELCFLPPAPDGDETDGGFEREVELAAEDLETSTHDGVRIDLDGLMREWLVLALPIAPRCGEDCQGPDSAVERGQGTPAWKEALARLKS